MSEFNFMNIEYFYLLIFPITILVWYFFKNKETFSHVKFSLIDKNTVSNTLRSKLRHLPFILKIFAAIFLIIALARPQSSINWQESTTKGIDIVLAMDISGSMLAQDLKPNRLEASKNVALDFISKRINDRIGLVIFSGEI